MVTGYVTVLSIFTTGFIRLMKTFMSYLDSIHPVPGVPQDDLVAVRGDVVVSGGANVPVLQCQYPQSHLRNIFVFQLT